MASTVTGTGNDNTLTGTGGETVFGCAGHDALVARDVQSIAFNPADSAMGTVTFLDASTLLFSSIEHLINADTPDGLIWGNDSAERIDGTSVDANGDRVDAGNAVYTRAQPDDNAIVGLGGADTIKAGLGRDKAYGDGDDNLQGSYGGDTLFGGRGADTPLGEEDADGVVGGAGDVVDGAQTGDDRDTLRFGVGGVVAYDPGKHKNGPVSSKDGSVLTFTNIENVVPCFTPGTMIQTDRGEMLVENIRAGDRVLTRDRGYRAIVWVGRRGLTATDLQEQPQLVPVCIAKGALGPDMPTRDMHVSPRHRLLAQGPRARLLFGASEVLIPALHLVGYPGITRAIVSSTDYIHLMCDRHEVIMSDGIWTESSQPGDATLAGMNAAQRFELETIFQQPAPGAQGFSAVRRTLRKHEADLLLA